MAKADAHVKGSARGHARPASTEGDPRPSSTQLRQSDIRAYNEAIAAARLVSIRLVASRFSTRASDGGETGDAPSASIGDRVRFHQFDEEAGRSFTVFEWELDCVLDHPPARAHIRASFMVVYEGLEGAAADTVERLAYRVGRFASFPYFRSFVAQTSGMAELDLPTLPMLKDQVHAATSLPRATAAPGTAGKGGTRSRSS